MVQYFDEGDVARFDNLSFRRDKRTGYYLNAKTHKRLHVYVWEYYNGDVPAGCHIHHKDGDKRNNEIDNLCVMTAIEHALYHDSMMDDERRAQRAKNVTANAMPKAKEWHKSAAGREWHKEHYAACKDKLHKKKMYVCPVCGKDFEAVEKNTVHYCSNNCKSKARRLSGVDDIIRVCVVCGKEFKVNKYAKAQTCSRGCGQILRRRGKSGSDTE